MKISNETKIGALTVVALAILILGYSFLKGNDVFSTENKFYAVYSDVSGLAVAKPVLVNGFQIGRVSKMRLLPSGHTLVEFKVQDKYDIPKNTIAKLEGDILGSKTINFEYGNSKTFAVSEDTLQAFVKGGIAESLQPVQKKAELIIGKMDSILTSVNAIMNPRFQKNVDRSFNSIANTLQALEGTTQKVDALVGNQSVRINNILANVESISANLKSSNKYLSGTMANFNKISDDVAKGHIKETLENANKAVADLQATIAKINAGQGSLGLLLNDDKMYNNLKDASANLNNLFIDIKAHPKNYVSFSVFGGGKKKD
ncbi:phospholipid/cholesterol/gamma-HCH transport system substrate-binding protein [Mucilaginibacter gracilis]|uniref:Phospholipid/cholesterol/gamma-HCH transport system substrate-binding protein n=1 Tax=Mucilaginibacter gracilis TaxID=423350 RepID=A0A495J5J1_9SPHI|nr:MlaD family protein [Mucilaginibacter gracilis]RKR83249.1 phospholipid/cholesterol/gamma-HCH transport system substrate-binding protein [Mucilaginibacter gracilis]